MIGLLVLLGLAMAVVGGLWLFDRYVQSRGGDDWHW